MIPFPNWPNSSMFRYEWNQGSRHFMDFWVKIRFPRPVCSWFDFSPVQHYYWFFVGPLFQDYRRRGTHLHVAYLQKPSTLCHRICRYLRYERVMLSASNFLLLDLSAQSCECLDGNLYLEDIPTESRTLVKFGKTLSKWISLSVASSPCISLNPATSRRVSFNFSSIWITIWWPVIYIGIISDNNISTSLIL